MPTWAELLGTWAETEGTWETASAFVPQLLFQPPIRDELPRVTVPMRDEGDARFWSYFRRGLVAVNVYKLTDGTYTEIQPGTPGEVSVWYLGGHIYDVSETEAASLEAAGYTVIGTEPPEPVGAIDEWSDLLGTQWSDQSGFQWADL